MENIAEKINVQETTKFEIIWGNEIKNDGFAMIPNVLIRNYRKLGIQHGEFGFLAALLTFKHDARNPYPSRKTLAEILDCSEPQITKWVTSLKKKGFLKTAQTRNEDNTWNTPTYDITPLIQKLISFVKPLIPEVKKNNEPVIPQVNEPLIPEVNDPVIPEVSTKRDLNKIQDLKEKEIKRDLIDHDSINSNVFEKYKDQITEQEFTAIVNRIKEQGPIFNYESYLVKSVQTAIQEKATKKHTFNMVYKRNEKRNEQPEQQGQREQQKRNEQPKPSRKSSSNQKQEIPVVDHSNEEAPVITEEELEAMIRFAEEMQEFKPEGPKYRHVTQ